MSQVLVFPPVIPAAMVSALGTEEPPTSQLHWSAVNSAGDQEVSVEDKRMASQLAYLASQHHTSEYNRLKFGPAGAPVMYIPLSIQLPAQVREMRIRQARNAQKRTWWPAEPVNACADLIQPCAQGYNLESPQQENVVPRIQISNAPEPDLVDLPVNLSKPVPPLNHPPALNLRRELSVAMSSPLSIITIPQLSSRDTYQQPNLDIHAKTSESHPINISPIVPFELLPLISSHLVPTPPHTAYMFDLPPYLLLGHITTHASTPSFASTRSYPMIRTPSGGNWTQPRGGPSPASLFPGIWQKPFLNGISGSSVAMDVWTLTTPNGDLRLDKSFQRIGNDSDATIRPKIPPTTLPTSSQDPATPHNGSLLLPITQTRPHSAPPSFMASLATPPEVSITEVTGPPKLPELVHAMSSDILSNNDGSSRSENPDALPSLPPHGAGVSSPHDLSPPIVCSLPVLGNMLLSSCPGKKVRLNGPVRGRGAICRDLGHDLKRVRALGVGCVICCLDDEELEFLGASWPQYSEVARQVGLDVLRIPIPEGLGPVTPAQLDGHLSHITHSYTLKGVPVLVHCRGGVGRAGLVACCWMLKLGLCGWLPSSTQGKNGHVYQGHDNETAKLRKETIHLVERVVAVVRRRRSVKAIETYEQVRFLVEFVEYLQNRGGIS